MVTIKQLTLLTVGVGILAFLAYSLAQERRPQASGIAPPVHQAIRITFGELQERETDYSGTLTLNEGRVAEIIPWRFFGGEHPGRSNHPPRPPTPRDSWEPSCPSA